MSTVIDEKTGLGIGLGGEQVSMVPISPNDPKDITVRGISLENQGAHRGVDLPGEVEEIPRLQAEEDHSLQNHLEMETEVIAEIHISETVAIALMICRFRY